MSITSRLSLHLVLVSTWLTEHRTLVRLALIALPVFAMLALSAASPAFACSYDPSSGNGGC